MTKARQLSRSLFGLIFILLFRPYPISAQKKPEPPVSPVCARATALQIIQEQVSSTKSLDELVKRVEILIRAAELLWPYENAKARLIFEEAFDLATRDHKEKGNGLLSEGAGLVSETPDQRFRVISAISKRDPAWARKLADQILTQDAKEVKEKGSSDTGDSRSSNRRLLEIASQLLLTDQAGAMNFARSSLHFSASLSLPQFLYELAEHNKNLADQFYEEALAAYASKPIEEFLYLSSYPFANVREAGEMPAYADYRLPHGFAPNTRLERLFVLKLLAKVSPILSGRFEGVSQERRFSDSEQLWLALTRLEKQIQLALPDLAAATSQARESLYPLFAPDSQSRLARTLDNRNRPLMSLDEQVEAAEKESDPVARERRLAIAVVRSRSENLDQILRAADRISDANLRDQLVGLIYFLWAQKAIKNKQLDEARKLAEKVREIDRRAYLYLTIAEEFLQQPEGQIRAREMLEEVSAAVKNAPCTIVSARAFLGLAHLFGKFDGNRSVELLGNAVSCINRLEAPDFSSSYVGINVEGKGFGFYTGFETAGFSPETVFQEVGKEDFDGVLYQAASLSNKPLRALTTLAVVEPCLKPSLPKQKRKN